MQLKDLFIECVLLVRVLYPSLYFERKSSPTNNPTQQQLSLMMDEASLPNLGTDMLVLTAIAALGVPAIADELLARYKCGTTSTSAHADTSKPSVPACVPVRPASVIVGAIAGIITAFVGTWVDSTWTFLAAWVKKPGLGFIKQNFAKRTLDYCGLSKWSYSGGETSRATFPRRNEECKFKCSSHTSSCLYWKA